jgi:acetyl-CoA C-acetyltransferase
VAAINGGCAQATPAFNVNRLCGSGLQAIVSASQAIMLGGCRALRLAVAPETLSRGPYASLSALGRTHGDTKMVDMVVGALHDPFHAIHMGVTAENVAAQFGITRDMQDALAVESHNRAQRATEAGYFKDQIVPVMLKSKKGDVAYVTDEHFRANCKLEDMAKLKPVFIKENGTVTAGNASGIDDARRCGADGSQDRTSKGCQAFGPFGGLRAHRVRAQDHGRGSGIGLPPGLAKSRFDRPRHGCDRSQRSLCSPSLRRGEELGLDPAKVNPNGSGISLGHPIGATGALITVKALYELQRIQGKYALVTMCIGGGQGIAAIFERM